MTPKLTPAPLLPLLLATLSMLSLFSLTTANRTSLSSFSPISSTLLLPLRFHTLPLLLSPLTLPTLSTLSTLPTLTEATVTLSSSGRQFPSRPAAFGMPLEYGLQYVALLQHVEGDEHLCAGVREVREVEGVKGVKGVKGVEEGKEGKGVQDVKEVEGVQEGKGGGDSNGGLNVRVDDGFEEWSAWSEGSEGSEGSGPSDGGSSTFMDWIGTGGRRLMSGTWFGKRNEKSWMTLKLPREVNLVDGSFGGVNVNEFNPLEVGAAEDNAGADADGVEEANDSIQRYLRSLPLSSSSDSDTNNADEYDFDAPFLSSDSSSSHHHAIPRHYRPGHSHTTPRNVNGGEYEGEGAKSDVTEKGKGGNKEIHVVPSHGVPVALLAKRGQCTYETKARVASQLTYPRGVVRFVIVYDDDISDGDHLITMMPKQEDDSRGDGHEIWKDVGLVFVSYESGIGLKEFINVQSSEIRSQGGPRILIDGTERWFPYSEPTAGLALLLMLFGCICSLSLFLSTTALGRNSSEDAINEHHLFLLGPDGQVLDPETRERQRGRDNGGGSRRRRGNGLRLLTLEEVETLPTRPYESPQTSPNNSSLELRNKTDMPYMDDDDENDLPESCNLRDSSEDEDDSSHRGGLCEQLLPSKGDCFNHNSCSICLDEYEVGEQIRVLPCQHTFHSNCIFPWLTERSPTCPLCKAMFEAVRYDEDEEENGEGNEAEAGQEEREGSSDQQNESNQRNSQDETLTDDANNAEANISDRERRRRRRAERHQNRSSRRSAGHSSSNDASSPTDENRDAVVSNNVSNDVEDTTSDRETREPSSSSGGVSFGLRGRLRSLFRASSSAATEPSASVNSSNEVTAGANNLEEPLLASDERENIV